MSYATFLGEVTGAVSAFHAAVAGSQFHPVVALASLHKISRIESTASRGDSVMHYTVLRRIAWVGHAVVACSQLRYAEPPCTGA